MFNGFPAKDEREADEDAAEEEVLATSDQTGGEGGSKKAR